MKLAPSFLRRLRETEDVQDDDAWLGAVLDIVAPELDGGLGVVATRFDVADLSAFRVDPLGVALPNGLEPARVATATMAAPAAYVQASYRVFDCITTSEAGSACERGFVSKTHDYGFHDALSVGAILPNDTGCMFIAGRRARSSVTRRSRDQWRGFTSELKRVLAGRAANHCPAPSDWTSSTGVGETSASWRQLEAEGWVRVRSYTVGDRPHVVMAHGKPAQPRAGARALSPRERDATRLAITGLANKVIAYELGIATSTVGVLLSRAMGKLGVTRRGEIESALRALEDVR